jgi:hypothetical protein
LYATVCQEEGAFTVTVRLLNHRNQSQVAWGEEIAETVEVASSMIGALAREFSIAEKCIAIELRMASLKEGTLHWRAEYEGKPTTTIHRAVQLLQGRVQALWELRESAVPYFKELDPAVAAFCEPGIGVLSWRAWMLEKQTAFLDRQCTPTTFRASALESNGACTWQRIKKLWRAYYVLDQLRRWTSFTSAKAMAVFCLPV